MNFFKWKFLSKYRKLLYTLDVCKSNKQRFHLGNGMILDFTDMTIKMESEESE